VLHATRLPTTDLTLVFGRYRHQSDALFSLLHFKLMLAIENFPTHAWSSSTTQEVLGSSCLVFDVASDMEAAIDLS
jgi:hypothetical protein